MDPHTAVHVFEAVHECSGRTYSDTRPSRLVLTRPAAAEPRGRNDGAEECHKDTNSPNSHHPKGIGSETSSLDCASDISPAESCLSSL